MIRLVSHSAASCEGRDLLPASRSISYSICGVGLDPGAQLLPLARAARQSATALHRPAGEASNDDVGLEITYKRRDESMMHTPRLSRAIFSISSAVSNRVSETQAGRQLSRRDPSLTRTQLLARNKAISNTIHWAEVSKHSRGTSHLHLRQPRRTRVLAASQQLSEL